MNELGLRKPPTFTGSDLNIDHVRTAPNHAVGIGGGVGGALAGLFAGFSHGANVSLLISFAALGLIPGITLGTLVDYIRQCGRDAALGEQAKRQNFFPVTLSEDQLGTLNRAAQALADSHGFRYAEPVRGCGGSVTAGEGETYQWVLYVWKNADRHDRFDQRTQNSSSVPGMNVEIPPGHVVVDSGLNRAALASLIDKAGGEAAPLLSLLFNGKNAIAPKTDGASNN